MLYTVQVRGITWAGTRTSRATEMVELLEQVLGLTRSHEEAGFVAFTTTDGDTVEVFNDEDTQNRHLTTGPVVGFQVDDVEAGRSELEQARIELIGPVQQGGGLVWQHFRAPDGNIWEITSRTG
jgi:glyoxylase I family protein